MTCIKLITREPCNHAEDCDNKECLHRKPHQATHGCWERQESYCSWVDATTYCPTRRKEA